MERTINWMQSVSSPGRPKANPWLEPTPGLEPWCLLAESPIRGMFSQGGEFSSSPNSRAFAVAGTLFYELFDDQTFIVRGTVSDAGISGGVGDSATITTNGTAGDQLAISAGGEGYIYDLTADTLTQITDMDFITPVYTVVFIDGYFVWLVALSRKFFWSALEDGLSYDALDVAEVSRTADDLAGMAQSHGQLWLFGQLTTDVWADTGGPAIFQPATGGFIEQGAAAPFAISPIDNTLMWLGQNSLGKGVVYRADGYTPKRVSDQGIEYQLSLCNRLDNAISWTYQDNGHSFYCLNCPALDNTDFDTTKVYDVSVGQWHEIAYSVLPFTSDRDFRRYPGRNHMLAFGEHLIGDRQTGAIYRQSLTLTDYNIYVP